jgi:hypothetical protein
VKKMRGKSAFEIVAGSITETSHPPAVHHLPLASRSAAKAPVFDVDPFSIECFEDPYGTHELLREAGPAVWLSRYRIWAVARYQEVYAVLNDSHTFCSGRGVGMDDFARYRPWRPPSPVLETDPPDHDRARAVLNRVLSPAAMKQLRASFAEAAAAKVAQVLRSTRFDAVAELAETFPLLVFPDAIGLRQEGREHLLPYASLAFNTFGPPNELRRQAIERTAPHVTWVTEQCQRENLTPDGLGAQIYAASDTGEITEMEASLLVPSLLTAGLETTVHAISAAIYCLARYPDQWQKLHQDPSLSRGAFREAIRLESPVQTSFRTTTRPVRIGSVAIGGGEKVLLLLGAANRDPRRWANPDVYDITRTISHVGFGAGVHICVGQLFARLEGEALLTALARAVASIEIAGEPKRAYNNTLRGLASLPIELVKSPSGTCRSLHRFKPSR